MTVKNERTSVVEYMALQPQAAQRVLQRVRRIIRRALQAEEVAFKPVPATRIRDMARFSAREVREPGERDR
jgi:hypothetical protein